jgi:transposase-like protein
MEVQKNKERPHKKRHWQGHSEVFKCQVAQSYLEGEDDQRVVAARYGVSQYSVSQWVKRYSGSDSNAADIDVNCDMKKKPQQDDEQALKQRIKELESALENERLKSLAWQTMVEVAEQELGIDIKKKRGTKQSKG